MVDSSRNNKFVQAKNLKNIKALRHERLARLSTSCPSLDAGWRTGYTSSLDVTQEEDEETGVDICSTTETPPHLSLDDESVSEEQDEVAAEADRSVMEGKKRSVSNSLLEEDGVRSRPPKPRSTSKEDPSRSASNSEEKSKVKRTTSLVKKSSAAGDSLLTATKSGDGSSLSHRSSFAARTASRGESAGTAAETGRTPVQRRSSFKTPMASIHGATNHLASKLFGLDKSRSVSTPSINADAEADHSGGGGSEAGVSAELHETTKRVATVKRRPSLFANLFSSHHNQEDVGSRRKSEGGNRLSAALSILGGHYHKGKEGSDENKKNQHSCNPAPSEDGAHCCACGKLIDGRQAVQCSSCLVILHDGCRSLPGIPCIKNSKLMQQKAHSLLQPIRHVSSVSPRYPKNGTNPVTAAVRRNSLSGALQDVPFITMTPEGSIVSTMSGSLESSAEGTEASSEDFELDAELLPLARPGSSSWSDTVDKKAIKKLPVKYVQRQDCIWEFIDSERQYVRALKIAQKVFARGMVRFCHFSRDVVDRLFPSLDSLVEMHVCFLEQLLHRQNERADKSIDVIGQIVHEQFGSYLGARVKRAYGNFVSRQREAQDCYKDLLRSNFYFDAFIKRCTKNPNAGNYTMLEIMNIIAQRMQKYRSHLEQLIKNTKDSKDKFDKDNLTRAADCVRRILEHIEEATELRRKELLLIEIYTKTDVRSVASYRGSSTFRKSDLLSNGRKLLHEGLVSCKNAREKESDVLLLLLSDVIVFLQESNQKYSFYPPDSKAVVLPLADHLLREKNSSKDNRTFCISRRGAAVASTTTIAVGTASQHTDTERSDIFELSCKTPTERREWVESINKAYHEWDSNCRGKDDGADDDDVSDCPSSKALEQIARVNELIERLHVKDEEVATVTCDRLQTLKDLQSEYDRIDEQGNINENIATKYREDNEFSHAIDFIRAAHVDVLRLASAYLACPFAVTPPSIGTSPADQQLFPAGHAAAQSHHRTSLASSLLPPPGSPLTNETFFGSFGRPKRLGRSVEDIRSNGRGSIDSDSDGTASATGPRPTSSSKPQWIRKWGRESGQGDGHSEQDGKRLLLPTSGGSAAVSGIVVTPASSATLPPCKTGSATGSASSGLSLIGTELAAAATDLGSHPAASCGAETCPELGSGVLQTYANAGHLSEYLQAVLLTTNIQESTISRYKQMSTEINVKVRELNQELEKTSQEKNVFRHNKQLEEIRSLREQIGVERQRWEAEKSEIQQHNEDERVRLEQLKHDLEIQRETLAREREVLQQQRQSASRLQSVPDDGARLPTLDSVDATTEFDYPLAAADLVAAHSRSLSADTKRSTVYGSGSDMVAPSGGGVSSHSPRWGSPTSQRRAAKTKSGGGTSSSGPAAAATAQSALVKLAAEAAASGGLHASKDKKKVPTKR